MILKILFAFIAFVVLIAIIFFFSWNYIIVHLPIEGIMINPLTFNQALSLAFISTILKVVGLIIIKSLKKILE